MPTQRAPRGKRNRRAKYHLALLQNVPGSSIDRRLVEEMKCKLRDKVTTPPEQTEICVWLESPGGDAHAAYKLFLELRHYSKYLSAVVPDYAKSAATLLLLGVDTIFMAPSAELGPLDVQLGHPDREDEIVSGLDIADSLRFLGQTGVELIIRGGGSVRQYTGLARAEVLKDMCHFTAQFLQPMTAKLDPHLVHRAVSQLKVAEQYAKRMLARRNLGPSDKLSAPDEDRLMDRLITDYPAHEFVISREEARSLRLPIASAETHPDWGLISQVAQTTAAACRDYLDVLTKSDVDKLAAELDTARVTEQKTHVHKKRPKAHPDGTAVRGVSRNGERQGKPSAAPASA